MARLGIAAIAQRLIQPQPQPPASHAAPAPVQHRQQARPLGVMQRFGQFQVAAGCRIQADRVGLGFEAQCRDVAQALFLGLLGVPQQRRAGGQRRRAPGNAVGIQVRNAERLAQSLLAQCGVEMPLVQGPHARAARDGVAGRFGHQHFGRLDARQFCGERIDRRFSRAQVAAGQHQPGDPDPCRLAAPARVQRDRRQRRVGLRAEQRAVGQRAGRDDAHDLALDRPLGCGRVADLLADGDRLAQPDQARQVLLDADCRNAGHRHGCPGRSPARGERQVQEAGPPLGIAVEELVKITHPVKQQVILVLRLDAQVLLHHRRTTYASDFTWFFVQRPTTV